MLMCHTDKLQRALQDSMIQSNHKQRAVITGKRNEATKKANDLKKAIESDKRYK